MNIDEKSIHDSSNNTTSSTAEQSTTSKVIQSIQDNKLIIAINTSNNNLDVSVSNDGLTLAIKDNEFSDNQLIQLERKIHPSSIVAKFSKKKALLTITGTINI